MEVQSDKSLFPENNIVITDNFEIILSPNPANEIVKVQINSTQQQNYQWQLFAIDGRSILLSGQIVSNTIKYIDVSAIKNGVYLFAINDDFGNTNVTRLIIIQ